MNEQDQVQKLATGIDGFDHIADGGLPLGRTTLVAGSAGSGKTVLAAQFLAEGIKQFGESGVFVTFEESVDDVRKNVRGFGWSIADWEASGNWAFVDASPEPGESVVFTGEYDMGALLERIEDAVRRTGASRVSMDSLGAVFAQFPDGPIVRRELFRMAHTLRRMGVTSLMTAERTSEYGSITRHGVEEFVADNVIILRNALDEEKRRRTIEILKFRGATHQKGQFPVTVTSSAAMIVIPLPTMELNHQASDVRMNSGNEELDRMCDGGFFRGSIILVSGATGTGKTLMATEFMEAGTSSGERSIFFGFEESREQLFRNASGWGVDFEKREKEGFLKVVCGFPETASLDDHLIRIQSAISDFKPDRVTVDSLSALERVSTLRSVREFTLGLTSYMKQHEVAGLFTSTSSTLTGGQSITEAHLSTITDLIILLRYVETSGEMRRGLTILKMRGSRHDREIRELIIDGSGMHIGDPFRDMSGIVAGNPHRVYRSEMERLDSPSNEEV